MTVQEQYAMMKKRHAFFNSMVRRFADCDSFVKDMGEWCALVGIDLAECRDYLEITVNLADGDCETYFALPSPDGGLVLSEIIRWQDDCCANALLNIFTLKNAVEEDIP